ncbi:terminase small subunit [uncultured Roseobacter sp.]|uniref:terminase small subunit n=1 Tax=uncultured Roseobacter sp. TaxID=114847 RepID=UPI002639DDEB|nr:terminase small subunit [uncultured Roseobacter sp.]
MSEHGQDRGDDGRFVPGTAIWKERSSHGRAPIYDSPEPLWTACCDYFEWASENPLYADTLVSYQGKAKHEPVAQMRAFTLKGMCLFIGISFETWRTWREDRPDLKEVMNRVEDVIYTQKFEGAAAGLLNAGLISRDLGLADRREIDDITPPERRTEAQMDIARAIAHIFSKAMTIKEEGKE